MSDAVKPSWNAELYAQARPDYPSSIINAILNAPASKGPLAVVDLGAGTGICSKLLIEACSNSAAGEHQLASITSLDAAPNMLKELSRSLYESGGFVPSLQAKGELSHDIQTGTGVARFENFEMSSQGLQGKVDLITIAQAWHWCSDWNAALDKIADVLKPGGVLAILWNLEDREAASWVARVRDLYEKHENNTPQYRHMYWKKMYDTPAIDRFDQLPPQKHTRKLPTTLEGVCNRMKSKSYICVLPDDVQEQVVKSIQKLMSTKCDNELGRVWIDKKNGIFEYPYATDLVLLRKK